MAEGLGSVNNEGGTFLSIAGGYIWDRKATEDHPDYATQDYEKTDKTTGTRKGARFADLTGRVQKVAFRTHAEYGESINVTFLASGNYYTVSISTGNRYSQDLMKALLVMDLSKPVFLKPYDFIGQDKKRAQGITFKQDGEKLDLKIEDAPSQTPEFFKKAEKKKIKRFFDDLNDWFIAEIEEKVVPKIKVLSPEKEESKKEKSESKKEKSETPKKEKSETPKKEEDKELDTPTPLAMKKVLRAYIAENYPGKELPQLSPKELVEWYNLSQQEEELPIEDEEEEEEEGELSDEELDDELNSMLDDED